MSFDEGNANLITEPRIDAYACQALWCAVIEAQYDLALTPKWRDKRADILRARSWFGSRDFFMVCALAGLDGDWLLSGIRLQFQMRGVAA